MLPYNKNLKKFARELRSNQTEAETFLWLKLRKGQLKNCRFYASELFATISWTFIVPTPS